MTNKRLSETTDDEILLELVEQQKRNIARLEKELKDKHKPLFSFDGRGLRAAFDHWTFGSLIVFSIIGGIVFGLWHIWPSTYETGRFYLQHSVYNYTKPPPPPPELDDCYRVYKEVENGQDEIMSSCYRNKDEAYQAANQFADNWKALKAKSGTRDD